MENKVVVRKIQVKDIPEVLLLIQQMYKEHDEAEPGLFIQNILTDEHITNYLNESLISKDYVLLVAEKDGIIMGVIQARVKKTPSFYAEKQIGYLDDLAVHNDFRRQGIGTLLTKHALEYLKSRGIKLVETKIYEFNEASEKLSESLGFKKTFSYYYKKLT